MFPCLLRESEYLGNFDGTEINQQPGNDNPKAIEHDEISPEVKRLWPAVDSPVDGLVEEEDSVVEHVAIHLAEADGELQWVAEGVVLHNKPADDEGERPPSDSCHCLHAHSEGISCQVSAVRFGVLFPQLAKEIGTRWHGAVVVGEIAYDARIE